MGLNKMLSRCLKGHLCNLGIQKPFYIDIPPIKEEHIPASFRIVLSLNLNICSDTITTAANRDKNPSISSACVAFQALVHHGLSIPSSVNEKKEDASRIYKSSY